MKHLKLYTLLLSLNLFLILANFCLTQSPQTLADIEIIFTNNGSHLSFTLKSTQSGTSLADSWLAVGFNSAQKMVF